MPRRGKLALALLALIAVSAAAAPLLAPASSTTIDFTRALQGPSPGHPFGTDDLGRDLLVRCLLGARVSLFVAILAAIVAVAVGLLLGGAAGYRRGLVDGAVMRVTDLALSIPLVLVVLFIAAVTRPGVATLCMVLGLTQWMELTRVVRASVLSLRERDFVEAMRALGAGGGRILTRHILRHVAHPASAATVTVFAQAMLVESAISFLGYGVQPPLASWGAMLQTAAGYMGTAPWVAFFPGLMIFVSVLCAYVVADALRWMIAADARRVHAV